MKDLQENIQNEFNSMYQNQTDINNQNDNQNNNNNNENENENENGQFKLLPTNYQQLNQK